jgi:hypothetical protein
MSNVLKIAAATAGAVTGGGSLYEIINGLGLTANLKLCLDAGDSASYDPGVQTDKWLDTSGNGHDFFRGSGTGSDAADPTFNGSAGGLSSNEYWSFAGGDYFSYDTTIETWMQNLSRNNAAFTFLIVLQIPNYTATAPIFVTQDSSGFNGLSLRISNTELFSGHVSDAATSGQFLSSFSVPTGSIQSVIVSVNEATPETLRKLSSDAVSTGASGYSNPSSSGEVAPKIGATTSGSSTVQSGTRIYQLAIWDTSLSSANIDAIFNGIKGRFGL